MKRLLLLLTVFAGATVFQSCEGDRGPAGPAGPEAEVFEIRNVNFTSGNGYGIFYNLDPAIYNSDMILVYRLAGVDNGAPVWQVMPKTYYPDQGEIDFNFDFTQYDINIYLEGTYDLSLTPQYTTNQTFRVVVIPGYGSNFRMSAPREYNSVVAAYNIQEKNVKVVNFAKQ